MPGPAVNVVPVPKFDPEPPEPVHHVTVAPAPATPLAVNVVVKLAQIGLAAAVAEVMAGMAFTVTVLLTHAPAEHEVPVPGLYLAKYVVVEEGAGIVAVTVDEVAPGLDVATNVPPQLPLKNSTVPFMFTFVGKLAVRVILAGTALEQYDVLLIERELGSSFHLLRIKAVLEGPDIQPLLTTLYLVRSAFVSELLVFLGKQQVPDEVPVTQVCHPLPKSPPIPLFHP